jgi:hypothetical protein
MIDWRLTKFIVTHALIGIVAGALASIALVWNNIAGLGDLIARSDMGVIAMILLIFGFALTFGQASVATAVLFKAEERDE